MFVCVVCWRLKCSLSKQEIIYKNASIQYFLPKWHVIKTKHTCRFGESGTGRILGGWKLPATLGACVQSQTHLPASMFVIKSARRIKTLRQIIQGCREMQRLSKLAINTFNPLFAERCCLFLQM